MTPSAGEDTALQAPLVAHERPRIDGGSEVLEEALEAGEIRQRAAAGAVLVALRGAGLQILSFAANIVLARLLLPHDFGLVALGNTIIVFGDLMANNGASQTLIRSPRAPDIEDLRAVMGFQLALTLVLAAAVALVALPLGKAGELAAVMCLSLPVLALRTAPTVMLERALAYRSLVSVEITESLVYYLWAIGTVVAGFGVWGLATGVVVRVVVGTALLVAIGPVKTMRPTWSWSRLRPVLGFGARLQATGALNFVRDQLLNVALAAFAGISTLGLWTLAARAFSIPMILFQALWRVSYPAMTRLMAVGEDTRAIVERSVGMVATAGSAPLCGLAAVAPAMIPAVFGARWAGAADALPPACLGFMIVGPVSVSAAGFLAAHGDAGTILRGAVLHTVAQFAIGLPLLPVLHLWGVGLGVLAACLVEAVVLGRRATQITGARLVGPVARPLLAGVVGGAAGWAVADSMEPTLLAAAAGGATALSLYLLVLMALPENMLMSTFWAIRRALAATR